MSEKIKYVMYDMENCSSVKIGHLTAVYFYDNVLNRSNCIHNMARECFKVKCNY